MTKKNSLTNLKINNRNNFFKNLWKSKSLYMMFLPCIILLGIFSYYPMYGITIAFKDFKILEGIGGSAWVGFKHFQDLFGSREFGKVLSNTLIISIYRLLAGLPAPLILAIMINEMRVGFLKKFAQTVSYFPHFISWIVVSTIFTQLLSPSSGIVNAIIKVFGGKPIYFMAEPSLFRHVLIVTGIWKEIGWGSILYLALLTQIDPSIYEASIIDGASRLQIIRYINIPFLMPLFAILMMLSMGRLLNGGFDQIFNMANIRVLEVSDIIDTYVYRKGIVDFNYSYSTVAGVFKNIVGLVFVMLSQLFIYWLNKRMGDREIYGLY